MPKGIYVRKKRTRFCSIVNCEKIHYARGFCVNHYMRDKTYRHGHPYLNENRIDIFDNFAEVVLENKKRKEVARAVIDISDIDMIRSFKWCLNDSGYAITNCYGTMIRMHVMIMGFVGVDHINSNRLDNRRGNLRKASYLQNNRNRGVARGKVPYKGVVFAKGKYLSRIKYDGKTIHIGFSDDPKCCANMYDQFAIQLFGDFAHTNFEYI